MQVYKCMPHAQQTQSTLSVGPGIDFRKFLWKFDGLGDRRFPEIPLEIWDLGGKSWGGDLGVGQVRRADRVN